MFVTELKEYSNLPQEFLDILPEYCLEDNCEHPMGISETLTSVYCTNPRCPAKINVRIQKLCKSLNIKGIGESMARKFINTYGITNPLQIYLYEPSDGTFTDECSMEVSQKLYNQIQNNRTFTLSEYVQAAQLPDVQSSAQDIFEGYSSLEDAYADIEAGGIEFIKKKLNISKGDGCDTLDIAKQYYDLIVNQNNMEFLTKLSEVIRWGSTCTDLKKAIEDNGVSFINSEIQKNVLTNGDDISIRAVKVYESLITYKQDLLEAVQYVNIRDTKGLEMVNVVISTSVGEPYENKKDFINAMNQKYSKFVHLNYKSSVTKDTHFLIWSGIGEATTKVRKARAINEKVGSTGRQIPILTGKEFDELCAEEFLGG